MVGKHSELARAPWCLGTRVLVQQVPARGERQGRGGGCRGSLPGIRGKQETLAALRAVDLCAHPRVGFGAPHFPAATFPPRPQLPGLCHLPSLLLFSRGSFSLSYFCLCSLSHGRWAQGMWAQPEKRIFQSLCTETGWGRTAPTCEGIALGCGVGGETLPTRPAGAQGWRGHSRCCHAGQRRRFQGGRDTRCSLVASNQAGSRGSRGPTCPGVY